MQQIKLYPTSPGRFRLGSAGLGATDDFIHSDTLFGGWVNAFVNLYGVAALPLVREAFEVGQCRSSSAFHFVDIWQNGQIHQTISFFPRPFLRRRFTPGIGSVEQSPKKKIKKLRYLSLELLRQMLQSAKCDDDGEWRFTPDLLAHTIFDSEYAVAADELPEALEQQLQKVRFKTVFDVPKVKIARTNIQSEDLFYETDCFFNRLQLEGYALQPGLFFLAQLPEDEQLNQRLLAALRLLADEGFGGERSSGAGVIERTDLVPFAWEASGSLAMLLSLTLPAPETNPRQIISGQTLVRGGYVGPTNRRKNRCRMLQEGAIVQLPFRGTIVTDAPDSLRYGQAFYFQFGD